LQEIVQQHPPWADIEDSLLWEGDELAHIHPKFWCRRLRNSLAFGATHVEDALHRTARAHHMFLWPRQRNEGIEHPRIGNEAPPYGARVRPPSASTLYGLADLLDGGVTKSPHRPEPSTWIGHGVPYRY